MPPDLPLSPLFKAYLSLKLEVLVHWTESPLLWREREKGEGGRAERETDRQTDGQTDRDRETQRLRHTQRQTERQTD